MTSIEELWSKISGHAPATGTFRLVDESHPLDLYAGFDHEGRRVLMLVTEYPPVELPAAGAVEVTISQRSDDKFVILFRLARPELDELFGRLCQDLVDTSRNSDRHNGTAALLLRLNRWRKLLELGAHPGLSERELRGLFGELWFLWTVAVPGFGNFDAVHGWNGPLDAPQDFQLGAGLVEVKTILPGAHTVSVSSAEQLEHGSAPLQLAVVVLHSSTGISPAELITNIRRGLEVTPGVGAEFELRLAEAGYADRPEYGQIQFAVEGIRYYPVTDAFPRIIPSQVPLGISRVTYDLDLHKCCVFRSEYIYAAG